MEPVAFLSYAHLDDAGSVKEISLFHGAIQNELAIHTGLPVKVFFDKKSIGWGKRWGELINKGIEGSAFFLPILTPAFFRSEACKEEYEKFLEVERRIGRRDLILPIYYVKCREFNTPKKTNSLVDDILSRQYRDWRELRHSSKDSNDIRREFAQLASAMADTFFEIEGVSALSDNVRSKEVARAEENINFNDALLDRDISYENIIAYSAYLKPDLPVSTIWTIELLRSLNRERYRTIRDLDREVKFAYSKVNEYALRKPKIFKSSTDYITKALIFVDSEFRSAHNPSPSTMDEALKAGITKY